MMHITCMDAGSIFKDVVLAFLRQKKILCLSKGLYMAGAERLELATPGFGDRCSTN